MNTSVTSLETARAKLAAGNPDKGVPPFQFEHLPTARVDDIWREIRTSYDLSLEELSLAKNAHCEQPQAGKY